MLQLIFTIYNLIFAALFCNLRGSEATSYSSEEFDESFEVSQKSKSGASSKKKKPKRNRSAFIIFSSEMRAKLRTEHKEKLNSNEMMVKLAELWKNLGEDEKKKYYDQAESEKVRYNTELSNFYQQNPFEVIQNKTKKNHIKKPCSAYAIYLKETKKDIKAENPDLKMADILKVVAEKWKKLTDSERIIFQKKALVEKELTQAKINQQQGITPDTAKPSKKESPKKSSSGSKRSSKAMEPMIKIDASEQQGNIEFKSEAIEFYPEPAPIKHQVMNYNYNFFTPIPTENYVSKPVQSWENEFVDYQYQHQQFQPQQFYPQQYQQFQQPRFTQFDSSMFNRQQPTFKEEFNYNGVSNLLSYLPQNIFAKPTEVHEFRMSKQINTDQFIKRDEFSDDEEQLPSTASVLSNEWHSSTRSLSPFMQDQVAPLNNVDVDDFKLDDQERDSFDKCDYWTEAGIL